MTWRPHGRAAVDAGRPRAWATCQRCGFNYNHDQLQWQYQWAGSQTIKLGILVCRTCLDVPQEQLRTIILPADPVSIENPRIEPYVIEETTYRVTEDGDRRVTEAGDPRIIEIGYPDGYT